MWDGHRYPPAAGRQPVSTPGCGYWRIIFTEIQQAAAICVARADVDHSRGRRRLAKAGGSLLALIAGHTGPNELNHASVHPATWRNARHAVAYRSVCAQYGPRAMSTIRRASCAAATAWKRQSQHLLRPFRQNNSCVNHHPADAGWLIRPGRRGGSSTRLPPGGYIVAAQLHGRIAFEIVRPPAEVCGRIIPSQPPGRDFRRLTSSSPPGARD